MVDRDGMLTGTDSQNRPGTAVGLEAIVGPFLQCQVSYSLGFRVTDDNVRFLTGEVNFMIFNIWLVPWYQLE